MELFLLTAALSLLGVVVSAVLFAAATNNQRTAPEVATVVKPAARKEQFFDDETPARPRVPVEALLLEIERHVRLEQAAAESFLHAPTAETLHSRTVSRLVH